MFRFWWESLYELFTTITQAKHNMVLEVRGFFECTQNENDQWVEEFEDSMLANFGDIDDRRKKAILMQLWGGAVKKFVSSLSNEAKASYKLIKEEIINKFRHTANETVERHIFNTMDQEEEETIEAFQMRLRMQAKKCNYTIPSREIK